MNPLIFFLLFIGLDIFLKSGKDKKKIERARQKKMQELRNASQATVKTPPKREMERRPFTNSMDKERPIREDDFNGERKKYSEQYKDPSKRYDKIDEKYNKMDQSYDRIDDYKDKGTLYDKNAINSQKREYETTDIRNYGRGLEEKEDVVPKISNVRANILNGIIYSEILGKPKSMQGKK